MRNYDVLLFIPSSYAIERWFHQDNGSFRDMKFCRPFRRLLRYRSKKRLAHSYWLSYVVGLYPKVDTILLSFVKDLHMVVEEIPFPYSGSYISHDVKDTCPPLKISRRCVKMIFDVLTIPIIWLSWPNTCIFRTNHYHYRCRFFLFFFW